MESVVNGYVGAVFAIVRIVGVCGAIATGAAGGFESFAADCDGGGNAADHV